MKSTYKNFLFSKVGSQLLMWFAIWLFFRAFFGVGSANTNFVFWFSTILSVITISSIYVFNNNLLPNFLFTKKYKHFIIYSFYAFIFLLCAILMTIVFGFTFFFNLEFREMPNLTKNPSVIIVCVLLMVAFASSIKVIKFNFRAIQEKKSLENKILQTQLRVKEEELKYLKMQIHPHFLFNTLNTMYGFAIKKADETPDLILRLSNLLDYILYQVNKEKVFLKDEINHIKHYISLEKYRFSDTLKVNFTTSNFNENIQIAPMILLPFVENAFKHGDIVDNFLKIDLDISIEENNMYFTIQNTFLEKQKKTKGLGLENIKRRLEFLYLDKHKLELINTPPFFKATLKLEVDNE